MLTDQPSGIGRLEHAATAGVVLLAAGSFVLSYDALHQLAVANNVPRPLAWIWPLIVDGFIITASLAVLQAVLAGRSVTYPWLLVLVFSATSVVFNVLHAPPTIVARLVAAIPPLTLVLSFELLMRQLRDRLSRAGEAAALPAPSIAQESVLASPTGCDSINGALGDYGYGDRRSASSILDRARELHEQHVDRGTRLTGKALGEALGISDGYARRLLRGLNATVRP